MGGEAATGARDERSARAEGEWASGHTRGAACAGDGGVAVGTGPAGRRGQARHAAWQRGVFLLLLCFEPVGAGPQRENLTTALCCGGQVPQRRKKKRYTDNVQLGVRTPKKQVMMQRPSVFELREWSDMHLLPPSVRATSQSP